MNKAEYIFEKIALSANLLNRAANKALDMVDILGKKRMKPLQFPGAGKQYSKKFHQLQIFDTAARKAEKII